MTTANHVTLSRLYLSLAYFPMLMFLPAGPWLALPLALLIAAGITDIVDGQLARKTNSVSDFGRVADAFIDRILVGGSYVIFLSWGLVDTWVVLVVVVREFLVGGMRNLADSRGLFFQSTVFGKTKFASQFAACAAVIVYRMAFAPEAWAHAAMDVVVYVSAANTLASAVVYFASYKRLVGAH